MGRGRCNCGAGTGGGGSTLFSNAGEITFSGDGTGGNPIVGNIDLPQLIVDLGTVLVGDKCAASTRVLASVGGTVRLVDVQTLRCRKML